MNINRNNNLVNKIVLLDGITGTGKTMFLSLINSFSNTTAAQFIYAIEYISIMSKFNKININEAAVLLKLIADEKYYNNLISREVNFRPNDLSSVLKSGKGFNYIMNLFANDGLYVQNRIDKEKPILSIVTHQLFSSLMPLFHAFEEKLFVIEMERHPLFLIKHWFTWIDLYGNNPRDLTVCIEHSGKSLPWFAYGWEDLFLCSNSIDRVIYSLEWLNQKSDEALLNYPNNQILFIPFEDFVLNPNPYISKLENILGQDSARNIKKVMRKQNIPRKNIFEGPNKKIYRRYGFQKNNSNKTHQESYQELLIYAQNNASIEAYNVLLRLNKKYEDKYGLWF